MNLKELRDEIKRLNSLKENREHCTIDTQLKAIKQTVEAVDSHIMFRNYYCCDEKEAKLWKEIKKLLNIKKGGK